MSLLLVRWHDAYNDATGDWKDPDDAESDPCVVFTVGWPIKETRAYLVLASTRQADGTFCNPMSIPKGCIVERRKLPE